MNMTMSETFKSLIPEVTAIVNKSTFHTKTDIYTLLKFVSCLKIFGREDYRVQRLRQAQKVMIPRVHDYFKYNGFCRFFDLRDPYYAAYVMEIVNFVKYALRYNVNGIVFYNDVEKRFYTTFYSLYAVTVFNSSSISTKRKGPKSLQTMIDLYCYYNGVEPVEFKPSFSHFTCSPTYFNKFGAVFKIDYSNGLSEEVEVFITEGKASLLFKTL